MLQDHEFKRLRWACRRGMLELDLLLLPYFEECFEHASQEEQSLFIRLLESSDQDLFDWLTHKKSVDDPDFQKMLNILLSHAQSKLQH